VTTQIDKDFIGLRTVSGVTDLAADPWLGAADRQGPPPVAGPGSEVRIVCLTNEHAILPGSLAPIDEHKRPLNEPRPAPRIARSEDKTRGACKNNRRCICPRTAAPSPDNDTAELRAQIRRMRAASDGRAAGKSPSHA
jgi:hypothetical protein